MFARLVTHLQMRRSTAFLLARADDRLLDDIGLDRATLQAMHLGLDTARLQAQVASLPPGGALPVLFRA